MPNQCYRVRNYIARSFDSRFSVLSLSLALSLSLSLACARARALGGRLESRARILILRRDARSDSFPFELQTRSAAHESEAHIKRINSRAK